MLCIKLQRWADGLWSNHVLWASVLNDLGSMASFPAEQFWSEEHVLGSLTFHRVCCGWRALGRLLLVLWSISLCSLLLDVCGSPGTLFLYILWTLYFSSTPLSSYGSPVRLLFEPLDLFTAILCLWADIVALEGFSFMPSDLLWLRPVGVIANKGL